MQHDLRNTDTYSTFPIEQTAKGFKKYNRKNKFSIFEENWAQHFYDNRVERLFYNEIQKSQHSAEKY